MENQGISIDILEQIFTYLKFNPALLDNYH